MGTNIKAYKEYIFKDGAFRKVASGGAEVRVVDVLPTVGEPNVLYVLDNGSITPTGDVDVRVVEELPEQAPEGTTFYLVEDDSPSPSPTKESKNFVYYSNYYKTLTFNEPCNIYIISPRGKRVELKGTSVRRQDYVETPYCYPGIKQYANNENTFINNGKYEDSQFISKLFSCFSDYNFNFARFNVGSGDSDKMELIARTFPRDFKYSGNKGYNYLFHATLSISDLLSFYPDEDLSNILQKKLLPKQGITNYKCENLNQGLDNIQHARFFVRFIKDLTINDNSGKAWDGVVSSVYLDVCVAYVSDYTMYYNDGDTNVHMFVRIIPKRFK